MTNYLMKFEEEVSAWPHVSVHAHRFGGREFRFGRAEIGHAHRGGIVDIPFTRPIHDVLLAKGFAEEHRWVPDSGWITFVIHTDENLAHALWLMRLSYIRYAVKDACDPPTFLEKEGERLRLSSELKSLVERIGEQKFRDCVARC